MRKPALAFLCALQLLAASGNALADSWIVDMGKSRLSFSGTQTGEPFEGQFERFETNIRFDPATPAQASVRAVIDMTSASTGDNQRDQALPQKDWFFVSMFPSTVFEANGFTPVAGEQYKTNGTLTLRGIEKPLTLYFDLKIDGDEARMTASHTLVRSDYSVGTGPWAEGKWVGLEVSLSIQLIARRNSE